MVLIPQLADAHSGQWEVEKSAPPSPSASTTLDGRALQPPQTQFLNPHIVLYTRVAKNRINSALALLATLRDGENRGPGLGHFASPLTSSKPGRKFKPFPSNSHGRVGRTGSEKAPETATLAKAFH